MMPGCSAFRCSNRSENGHIMKVFPKDPKRRLEWEIRVKRDNWKLTNNCYLCEHHFAEDAWEKVREDGSRKLKWKAVPTIFSHTVVKKARKSPKKRPSPKKPPSQENDPTLVDSDVSRQDIKTLDQDIGPASQHHFTEDAWEKVREDGSQKLKWTAVPKNFSHTVVQKGPPSPRKQLLPQKRPSPKKPPSPESDPVLVDSDVSHQYIKTQDQDIGPATQHHVAEDAWEKVREDGRQKLKWEAVPTIFAHTVVKKGHPSPRKQLLPKKRPSPKKPPSLENDPVLVDSDVSRQDIKILDQDIGPATQHHFAEDAWERVRADGSRTLKWEAVPKFFSHTVVQKGHPSPRKQLLPQKRPSPKKPPSPENDPVLVDSDVSRQDIKTLHQDIGPASQVSSEGVECGLNNLKDCQQKILKLEQRLEQYEIFAKRSELKISALKRKIRHNVLQKHREKMRSNQRGTNVHLLKQIFNDDQLEALHRQSCRGMKWSSETIKSALQLKLSCGSSGYDSLIVLGYPLPSQRTLRRVKALKGELPKWDFTR